MPKSPERVIQPFWATTDKESVRLYQGDVLEVLRKLPTGSVHCSISSPPYWGLRDYGVIGQLGAEKVPDCLGWARGTNCAEVDWASGCFVCRMVLVFRELRRVLRDDGTMWLNLGDTYANGSNLSGIPWRVALALQADGWVLRSDIPWVKRAPMPESVRNRPTKALEYVFLFSKKSGYYFDMEAVRRKGVSIRIGKHDPNNRNDNARKSGREHGKESHKEGTRTGTNLSDAYSNVDFSIEGRNFRNSDLWFQSISSPHGLIGLEEELIGIDSTSQGYSGAHFACVDDQTEALTMDGWKRRTDLVDGEIILAYDPNDGLYKWQTATFHSYDFNGLLVSIEKRDTSQWITGNHRCLVRKRTKKGYKMAVVKADCLNSRMDLVVSGAWGESAKISLGRDFAELVGWYVSEGEKPRSGSVRITQSLSANPEKVARIDGLLKSLGAEYSIGQRTREWRGRPSIEVWFTVKGKIASRLVEVCNEKMIPVWCHKLPEDEAQAMLSGIIDGDGHRRKDDGRCVIIQKSRVGIERMQILAIRCGYRAILKEGPIVNRLYLTTGSLLTIRATNGNGTSIKKVAYTGVVWCPSVSSGFWLARRNGMPFITGNTFPPKLIEPMILAGTSEKGCCAKCGKPWVRVVEKSGAIEGNREEEARDRSFEWSRNGKPGTGSTLDGSIPTAKTIGWEPGCECFGKFVKKSGKRLGYGSYHDHEKDGVAYGLRQDGKGPKSNPGPPSKEFDTTIIEYVSNLPLDEHPVTSCIVLDPFCGSGTTQSVSLALGRYSWGIDLSENYLRENAIGRIEKVCLERPALAILVAKPVKRETGGKKLL